MRPYIRRTTLATDVDAPGREPLVRADDAIPGTPRLDLQVEMRARSVSGRTNVADHLASTHVSAAHPVARLVHVDLSHTIMGDDRHVATAVVPLGLNISRVDSVDRGSVRGWDVLATVVVRPTPLPEVAVRRVTRKGVGPGAGRDLLDCHGGWSRSLLRWDRPGTGEV